MLRLDLVVKPWKESGALNAHINLYGFWNDEVFLTKSGDLGIVLRVRGVDYESLDQTAQEYVVKRLEAALKIFGPGFRVYQYLFKTNRPHIPFQSYDDPIVQAAVNQRKHFFESKLESLFEVEIFYAIVIEGTRSKTGVTAALKQLATEPMAGLRELKAQFSNDKMKVLLREHIQADVLKLEQRANSFIRQFADFVAIDALQRDDCFRFFRRLVNYDSWRIEGRPTLVTAPPTDAKLTAVPFAETRLCAVFSDGHAAAPKEHVTLEDFANDEWILLPRNVNATIHDTILETAARTGIPFRQAHGVINAEQAFYLVSERAGVAILPRPSTLGTPAGAVVVRPLSDPALSFETCLIMRRDDDSKLVNQYARAFLRKYARKLGSGRQMELPLSA